MKKKVLVLAALVMAMTATTLKAQLNVGSTSAPITTLDVQGNSYIRGNLGVGISAPGSKLHVAADAAAYGGQFAIGGVSNVNQQLQMGFNTATNQGYLQATVAGSTYNDLLLNPFAGNVGIGNTTPYAPLAFGNYTTNKKISLYGASNDNLFYGFGVTGGVLSYQVDNISASHVFYAAASATASNELMRITGAGNVGINTNSPQQKLEVNAANNPVRFSNLASTTSTTNILAIDASGDIRSIPATSVATGSTSAWSQVDCC